MLLTISASYSSRLFTEEVCEHPTKSILIPSSKRVPEQIKSLSDFTFFIHGKRLKWRLGVAKKRPVGSRVTFRSVFFFFFLCISLAKRCLWVQRHTLEALGRSQEKRKCPIIMKIAKSHFRRVNAKLTILPHLKINNCNRVPFSHLRSLFIL